MQVGNREQLEETRASAPSDTLLKALGLLSFSESDFDRAVVDIQGGDSFLGRGESAEFLSEVMRWRRFYIPSSLYGHRLGANVAILSRYSFADHDDLLVVDGGHVTKNAVLGEETAQRVRLAKERKVPVIGFFGGSTVQGYGARLPQYTIPAQTERILALRHGIEAVCVNYGVVGWTCAESLHLMIHEATGSVDVAVLYDGWNCCNEFFLRAVASGRADRNSSGPLLCPGTSFRHYEQDFQDEIHYSVSRLSRRILNLSVNRVLSVIARCFGTGGVRRFLGGILQRYFSIADVDLLREELDQTPLSREQENSAVSQAASEYLSAHAKVALWCGANGIRLLHTLQPLLPNSRKALTQREDSFRSSGLPWGKPHLLPLFRDAVKDYPGIIDLSDVVDDCSEEVFIDTGHLNMRGNFFVALRLSDLLAQELATALCRRG